MSVTLSTGRRVAAVVLGTAVVLAGATAPAVAHPPGTGSGTLSVTAQRLVLEPTAQGYVGILDVTVTNGTPTAAGFYSLTFLEPAGASDARMVVEDACVPQGVVGLRQVVNCGTGGVELAPGASSTHSVRFQVWTTPRDYPMVVGDSWIGVVPDGDQEPVHSVPFTTLFRSTKGQLSKPRPYVQATQTDVALTAGAVTLDRLPDGSLQGRMPVTVRYGNDAPSSDLKVDALLPAGVVVDHTEPEDVPGSWHAFIVPGGRFMPGEVRTFDVILTAPAGTPAGVLGTASYTAGSRYQVSLTDVDPADDTTSFTVTAG
ncbi:hypothetical protein [Micromonospora cathayae]|uniref:DUF11 domain-containing protein n=1 Tax=Micromonospora cathayae TaxID=3028804 RepID=A0ABY7ZI21_9ACTN|nr:hypothetical protein [Micromonospora sp. HUAS 3]WDZ82581.1 hypothetical protein PVK37_19090 [Micromonospora sp. HUAS 3]